MGHENILEVKDLKMHFPLRKGFGKKNIQYVKAVESVSFEIRKGETFGLVGESGCGKTTVGRTLMRLYEPTDGAIVYNGNDISHLSSKEMLPYRKQMQLIFQDPYTALDPRMTVGEIIGAPLEVHKMCANKEARIKRVKELLELVGLRDDHINRYPHEFSGGQRQRLGIARALAVEPEFIVCDEPISALDVSIQAQVMNILEEFQEKLGLTYLFISHDLSMVRHISNRVGVMYLGHLVEIGNVDEVFENMMHPYTQALFSAVQVADPERAKQSERIILEGDVPTPIDPPSGCPFRTRCVKATEKCSETFPEFKSFAKDHLVACHHI